MAKDLSLFLVLILLLTGCSAMELPCRRRSDDVRIVSQKVKVIDILPEHEKQDVDFIPDWDRLINRIDEIPSPEDDSSPQIIPRIAIDNEDEVYIYTGRVLGNPYR